MRMYKYISKNISKYKSVKTTINGITFASKKEANRYLELCILRQAGVISDLCLQKKYTLIPSQKRPDGKIERAVTYIADFVYYDNDKHTFVVEDVKGVRTKEFIIKRKLMLYIHGILVSEI